MKAKLLDLVWLNVNKCVYVQHVKDADAMQL